MARGKMRRSHIRKNERPALIGFDRSHDHEPGENPGTLSDYSRALDLRECGADHVNHIGLHFFGATVRIDHAIMFRIPLRHGRVFSVDDVVDRPRVAIVSETLSRRHWPHEGAVCRRISVGPNTMTVVGVVNVNSSVYVIQPDLHTAAAQFAAQVMPNPAVIVGVQPEVEVEAAPSRRPTGKSGEKFAEAVISRAQALELPWRPSRWLL